MNKTAIVTGAARGIGLEISKRFIEDGFVVAMLDIDAETLQKNCQTLAAVDQYRPIECDVSSPESVANAFAEIQQEMPGVTALVNNAGIADFKPFAQTGYSEWSEILAVNLHGAFLCSQAVLDMMAQAGGGSIVNITSISGLRASTLRTAYGTSKAALAHLTKQMAAELGDQGIRVNAVAPGPVDTEMAKKVHSSAIRADYHDAIPLNRYGSEAEIAAVVSFLCSEQSSYINGQEIAADGGFQSTGIGLSTLRQ